MLKIYTYADKRPDFLSYQKRCFDKFLKDEYQLIIINNGSSKELVSEIREIAKQLGCEHHVVENPDFSHAVYACARPICWSIEKFIQYDSDMSVIIDSDMFMIAPFSIREYMEGYDISGVEQSRNKVYYLWNGIVFMNTATLPNKKDMNFWPDKVEDEYTDVGGHLYYYLRDNKVKVKPLSGTPNIERNADSEDFSLLPKFVQDRYEDVFHYQIYLKAFFHYSGGSGWEPRDKDYHKRKTDLAFAFIEHVLILDFITKWATS